MSNKRRRRRRRRSRKLTFEPNEEKRQHAVFFNLERSRHRIHTMIYITPPTN
jgi:hypothetical protein